MRKSVTEAGGRKVDYAYDKLYRLTEERVTDVVTGNSTTSYVMDAVGNRLSKTDSITGATTYVYDANDRLLTETGAQTTAYTYDNNGNTKTKTTGTQAILYDWDDKNRLVRVQNPNGDVIINGYNENNIRVSQTVNGAKTNFLIDPNRDYAQVLEEYTNSGVQVSYVYGHDLIEQIRGGVASIYLVDGLGSTKALTNGSGVVTDRYLYDAYGNVLSSTGTTPNKYLYTGEQFDSRIGQNYLRDRFYDPKTGRFTRSDSFGGDFNQPLSLNKYLYTHGNPINSTDPSGMITSEVLTAVTIIAILAALTEPLWRSESLGAGDVSVEVRFRPAIGPSSINHAYILLNDYNGQKKYVYSAFPSNGSTGDWSGGYLYHGYVKPKSWDSFENSDEADFPVTFSKTIYRGFLPAIYFLNKLESTKDWLEQQRFRYTYYAVNSNSAGSQWMYDLVGYRLSGIGPAAPGWDTHLRDQPLEVYFEPE